VSESEWQAIILVMCLNSNGGGCQMLHVAVKEATSSFLTRLVPSEKWACVRMVACARRPTADEDVGRNGPDMKDGRPNAAGLNKETSGRITLGHLNQYL
jgi:hypothetical protein